MITIKQIRGAGNYFKNYLSQNEYYSQGQKVLGHWRGKLAEMLGIGGKEVNGEDFEKLANNRHPQSGEKLRPRSAKVCFHDVVVSAPKSYSIAALVGKDERLTEGFERAVQKTFKRLEKVIAVRERGGAAYHTESFSTTGNGAAAVFLHDDNRLLDPQLHMHMVFSNHSFSGERDQYLALQPKPMMDEAKRWITDQFHRDLAKEARDAGYAVSLEGDRLRLSDVGLKLEYKFSKRAQQRRRFEKRYRQVFGRDPDRKRVEYFIKEGRAAARKRFGDEYQAHFGKQPSSKELDRFVVDWRTQKKISFGEDSKFLYQRGQLTSLDAKRLDELVVSARRSSEKIEGLDREGQSQHERANQGLRQDEVSREKLAPDRGAPFGARRRRRKVSQKRHQPVGRAEAIRRMRRGMDIARALQGHPGGIIIRQLMALSRRMNHDESRKEEQTLF